MGGGREEIVAANSLLIYFSIKSELLENIHFGRMYLTNELYK
jgi:hypothetical protein